MADAVSAVVLIATDVEENEKLANNLVPAAKEVYRCAEVLVSIGQEVSVQWEKVTTHFTSLIARPSRGAYARRHLMTRPCASAQMRRAIRLLKAARISSTRVSLSLPLQRTRSRSAFFSMVRYYRLRLG